MFTVGLSESQGQQVADAFNCKLGAFPMKYLGLPISDERLSKGELSDSAEKIEKKLHDAVLDRSPGCKIEAWPNPSGPGALFHSKYWARHKQ